MTDQPRVWLVLGDKQGDNRQVEVLAQALGWAYECKHMTVREPFVRSKPRVSPSLHHIDRSKSDALEQPWPDLIITIGRRPSMVALWIREQSAGRAKIVLIGKPSGRVEWYDLIIASREIVLPPLPNVVTITLPLMQIDEATLLDAAIRWRAHLSKLPHPLIGILIGGPTIPFVYKKVLIRRLLQTARDLVRDSGGTPYITSSRRTPAWAVEALQDGLPAGGRLFCWTPEAEDNPYTGLLALADGFVVTGDSISMIVEAIKAGKPVSILPVPAGASGTLDQLRRRLVRWLFSPDSEGERNGFRQATGRLLYRLRVATHTRDFRAFHQHLFDLGLAAPANQGVFLAPSELPADISRLVARIKALTSAE
jgi:mitochondrial fission protein ELM1